MEERLDKLSDIEHIDKLKNDYLPKIKKFSD